VRARDVAAVGVFVRSEPGRHRRRGVIILLGFAAAAVVAGQFTLDLLTVDDLREAEVAREMVERGDIVVPHLAGLPFVEKPPGFQCLVALAYIVTGGPSIAVARLVSAAFAVLTLAAVFLLGRRLAGEAAGAVSAVALATSLCFLRVAYTVLLDNALAAALAWALLLTWMALDSESESRKRRFAAGALLAVGISFLFKGFVGPALYGAGMLAWVASTRRWAECRSFLRPMALAAFLGPVLVWVLPFTLRASAPLLYEFFVLNHVGRAVHAYDSHSRPVWYYAASIWVRFAPASVLLPFAALSSWRERGRPEGRGRFFLLCFAAGATALLSASKAKDYVYLLPIYPALACLVGTWAVRMVEEQRVGSRVLIALVGIGAALAIGAGLVLIAALDGVSAKAAVWAALLAAGGSFLVLHWRRGDAPRAGWAAACLVAMAPILAVTAPLSSWYADQKSPRPTLRAIVDAAAGSDIVLYRPEDRLRGGCGFYRNRTAEEIDDPEALVTRLKRAPGTVAVVANSLSKSGPELQTAAERAGVVLEEFLLLDHPAMEPVGLVRLRRDAPGR
jgi:4-amino-4-deoxy-L-arabinose transferase-like glycosyltransferase